MTKSQIDLLEMGRSQNFLFPSTPATPLQIYYFAMQALRDPARRSLGRLQVNRLPCLVSCLLQGPIIGQSISSSASPLSGPSQPPEPPHRAAPRACALTPRLLSPASWACRPVDFKFMTTSSAVYSSPAAELDSPQPSAAGEQSGQGPGVHRAVQLSREDAHFLRLGDGIVRYTRRFDERSPRYLFSM